MTRRGFICLLGALSAVPPSARAQTGQPTAPPPPPPPAVKVGEKAPDFKLPYLVAKADGSGVETRQVTLSEHLGKRNVVLAFFPAAFSPG
jgi:hypothetical protein